MRRAGGIAAVLLLLGAAFATGLLLTRPDAPVPKRVAIPESRLLDEVRRELTSRYYRPVPRRVLREHTVEGLLTALDDPYTEYLNATEYGQLRDETEPTYSGVGLSVEPSKRGLLVRSAFRGPAREAGISRGDVIVAVDGRRVGNLAFDRALTLFQGETGTKIRLTIRRERGAERQVTVVRQRVSTPTIRSRLLGRRGGKVGYVRLLSFPTNASERVAAATRRLVAGGARALVLDLRNNPGGLLSQAVGVASLFQKAGVVCTTEGRNQPPRVLEVTGDALYPNLPLVVLVNRGSASASEIVAGALRDHGRATVLGERTYGKALVQTIRELSNGEALKLTTAAFVTPTGLSLDRGLRPDVHAVDHPTTRADEAVAAARRALLKQLAA
ncbi:MAG: S41 family peptidase [Actinobacteria bacterium]|nr:S41 family peptidase [Actinomycetota bacterium]